MFQQLQALDAETDKDDGSGAVVLHLCADGSHYMSVEKWGCTVAERAQEGLFYLLRDAVLDSNPAWEPELEEMVEAMNAIVRADEP